MAEKEKSGGEGDSPSQSGPALLAKADQKSWRQSHDLHVLLIMKQVGLSKPNALVQAYSEGLVGLNKRLGLPS